MRIQKIHRMCKRIGTFKVSVLGIFFQIRTFEGTARTVLKLSFCRTLREHVLTNDVKAAFQESRGICAVVFVSTLEVEVNITRKPREKGLHIKLMILLG